jgi:membrane protein DedA with SNARE-associated domain
MGIIEIMADFIKDFILALGYPGIVFLMGLESMVLPIPSEVVMPFAGWLAFEGEMNWIIASIAGTIGCTLGSLVAYYIGYYGGRPLILRYGKYVLLQEKHLDSVERWFKKYGTSTVFFTRLLPVLRTFISIPAGIARMNVVTFTILTTIGSAIWCFLLTYAGYILGPEWESIIAFFEPFEVLIIVAAVVLVVYYFFYYRKRNAKNESADEAQLE